MDKTTKIKDTKMKFPLKKYTDIKIFLKDFKIFTTSPQFTPMKPPKIQPKRDLTSGSDRMIKKLVMATVMEEMATPARMRVARWRPSVFLAM